MRTSIYLIRHAESQSNKDPLSRVVEDCLTEDGIKQSESLSLGFKDIKIEKIFTSKVLRAKLTGAKIGETVGVEPTQIEYLKERKGSYVMDLTYVHSETFEDFKKRLEEVKIFLENLSHKHVIVVSHAIFIKGLVSYIMLEDSLTEDLLVKIDNTLVVDNASVSKFTYNQEKQKWHLEYLNDKTHLN